MTRLSVGAVLLAATFLGGCRSAHIEDVYVARDKAGVRRTDCINANAEQFHIFIEVLSFREDTLVWPIFSVEEAVDEIPNPPFVFEDDELREFGNFAPGKGEFRLSLSSERVSNPSPGEPPPAPYLRALYRMDVFLNDDGAPSETLLFTIDDNEKRCPFSPLPNTY